MIIITSLLCNQKCPYCFFYKTNPQYNKEIIDINIFGTTISNILERIYVYKEFYDIRFFWAEQLLNNNISNLIYNILSKLDKNKAINIYINTNLTTGFDNMQKIFNTLSELSKSWYNINFEVIITFSVMERYFMDLRSINIDNYIKLIENIKKLTLLIKEHRTFSTNIINNYVIDIKKIIDNKVGVEDIINDINSIKTIINIKYFNILPIAYNYVFNDNDISLYKKILERIKEENKNQKILPLPEEYFEQYMEVNNKYYIPLYPYNLIIDFYGNISYNLINYEDFWLLNFNVGNIKNIENLDKEDIFNIDLSNKEIPIQQKKIITKLYNKFGEKLVNNTDNVYKLTNKILYN